MKDKGHIQSFGEFNENLNISDVSGSDNFEKVENNNYIFWIDKYRKPKIDIDYIWDKKYNSFGLYSPNSDFSNDYHKKRSDFIFTIVGHRPKTFAPKIESIPLW